GTATRTQYAAGSTPVTDTNGDSMEAEYYQFGAGNSPYANVTMGGLPYTTGLDDHATTYVSGSSSAPVGAFSLMYEGTSGGTVTGWNIDASMLFMTSGYTEWSGHEIICDPVFVSYTSAQNTPMSTGLPAPPSNVGILILIVGVVSVSVIILVLVRRRK
ncbi:MAG: hypothetical protein ACTSUB_10285, partial [Candidatus Thorarchaeota archaeon]